MKKLMSLFFIIQFLIIPELQAGGQEGGAGGYVHDQFIAAGRRVLYYLNSDPNGQLIVSKYGLNICRLNATLNEKLIYVYEDTVVGSTDARGSEADAFTFPWHIHLAKSIWESKFRETRDFYNLVFKEMLRSEKTYFDQALEISNLILPFPQKFKLENQDRRLNGFVDFVNQLQLNQESCLTEEDRVQIKGVTESLLNLFSIDSPHCFAKEIEQPPGVNSADAILNHIVSTPGCRVVPTPCFIQMVNTKFDSRILSMRMVVWRGQNLHGVPYSSTDISTGQTESLYLEMFEIAFNNKIAQLEKAGICQETSREPLNNAPKTSQIMDSTFGLMSFAIMTTDIDKKCEKKFFLKKSCFKKNQSFLGVGSTVELLDRKIYRRGPALWIRVRVIENSLQQNTGKELVFKEGRVPHVFPRHQKSPISQKDQIGYIGLSMTEWGNYFDPEIDQIIDLY